jgi:hypothetical protein
MFPVHIHLCDISFVSIGIHAGCLLNKKFGIDDSLVLSVNVINNSEYVIRVAFKKIKATIEIFNSYATDMWATT